MRFAGSGGDRYRGSQRRLCLLSPLLAALLALAPNQGTGPPHLVAVKTPAPPLIDGRLQDPVWQLAPGTSAFTQSFPFDGARPSEPTVLRVLTTRRQSTSASIASRSARRWSSG